MSKKTSARFPILLSLLNPQIKIFLLGLLALAAGSSINLIFPEIIRYILNTGDLNYWRPYLLSVALGLIILFAIQGFCFYWRSMLFTLMGQRIIADLRKKLFDKIIQRPVCYFDQTKSADLVSRISNDAQSLQDALSIKLSVVIRYALQVLIGIILMLRISATLTAIILLMLPVLVLFSISLAKKLKILSKQQQIELGIAASHAQQTLDGIRLVKAFGQEGTTIQNFADTIGSLLSTGMQRAKVSAFFQSFVSFLLNVAIVIVILIGLNFVVSQRLASGDLTAFLLYGTIVAVSFALVAGATSELIQAYGAAERVFDILEIENTLPKADLNLPAPTQLGTIEFDRVNFNYPARPEQTILKDISFSLPQGKVTALVGPSGNGKSTVVNLILGFYQATTGEIKIGGKNIIDLDINIIRSKIAWVPQEQTLFAASIAENLRFAKQAASKQELEAACLQANIFDFIQSLPQGLDTFIGERGVQLSTGQKQRLAIARAILKDPELLILDEATSALDSENEHLIQEAIDKVLKGRTALIIAHRLSTIKNASQVLVLDQGQIVQRGTHQSLANSSGLYQQLVAHQDV